MGFSSHLPQRLVIFRAKKFLFFWRRCASRHHLAETCPAVCAPALMTAGRANGGVGHGSGDSRGVRALRLRFRWRAQRV